MVSSRFLMKMGILRAPGDLRMRVSWVMVCSRIWGGQMSILVITTITGTFRARAIPKCSLCCGKSLVSIAGREFPYLLIPMRPLFAATMRRQ